MRQLSPDFATEPQIPVTGLGFTSYFAGGTQIPEKSGRERLLEIWVPPAPYDGKRTPLHRNLGDELRNLGTVGPSRRRAPVMERLSSFPPLQNPGNWETASSQFLGFWSKVDEESRLK